METIDFSCLVRVLNRQRLTSSSVAAGQQQLNKTASQFLSVVRNNNNNNSMSSGGSANINNNIKWMKLRLSDRGLRLYHPPTSSSSSRPPAAGAATAGGGGGLIRDDGFDTSSDYDYDDVQQHRHRCSNDFTNKSTTPIITAESVSHHSGASSAESGVNSSSSDIDESTSICCCRCCCCNVTTTATGGQSTMPPTPMTQSDFIQSPIKCPLDHILSCQLPQASHFKSNVVVVSDRRCQLLQQCMEQTPPLAPHVRATPWTWWQ